MADAKAVVHWNSKDRDTGALLCGEPRKKGVLVSGDAEQVGCVKCLEALNG